MSLPITAVGPLNVLTNPILMESAAIAGFASARTVAPASQNAVLISFSLLAFCVCHQSDDLSASGFLIIGGVLCARSIGHAASATFGFPQSLRTHPSTGMHHNSYRLRMARIIVLVGNRRS